MCTGKPLVPVFPSPASAIFSRAWHRQGHDALCPRACTPYIAVHRRVPSQSMRLYRLLKFTYNQYLI